MELSLSDLQRRIFDALPPDTDVETYKLYEAAFKINVHVVQQGVLSIGLANRTMQQRLGAPIARINEKLTKGRIVPGHTKRTYRYDTKAG